ncbi:methionyl-tRNA synthetase [Catalinimonas alkaloidigena]|uniref:methionine--tRNA ligase n=1 Tax=Catalinimonas alkaloidigena TaxID=1075417 RepID=UPI0024055A9E|nr:methionine--tRNA ligase [Catalinimonas alkaloidigena]MDF9797678.1 methionyl-tRNA synthetase [Catalinimonas alkaloidigena]
MSVTNNKPKRYTITAALPYANGPLHLGHIAGAYLPADIYVRYLRLTKKDVVFIGGSDEHGVAITLRAKKEGISPQEIIDKYHFLNKETFEKFGISFDMYHRTSEKIHHETSQEFFSTLYDKGEFIEKDSEQFYDEEFNQFLADRYIVGTCPICKYENAYGDQCENCGSSLNPTDLINPKSTLSGKAPILKETKHWYLPLDKYQPWLEKWLLEGKKGLWKSNVYGQCSAWLQAGLQPRAMTRDLDWGVDVPLPNTEGKKLYVWLDAPIGYISSTKQWAKDNHKDWELYWKQQPSEEDNSRLIHFIGKDNIVFHCIIFPSILHANGQYILPENVPANEFLNLEGKKISTSRNWAVWLHEYLEDFPNKQDILRYVLCSILPETKDSEFTWKDFQAKNNNELVAIYGNFINRTLILTHKYFDGFVPEADKFQIIDQEALGKIKSLTNKLSEAIENFRFREANAIMMDLARVGNKYLADTEPWKAIKEDENRVKTILNVALQIAGGLSILSEPFLPFTAQKLRDMLNIEAISWHKATEDVLIVAGHKIGKAELLFEKVEDEVVEAQIQKLLDARNEASTDYKATDPKAEIAFPDFEKVDIRVAKIIEAEKVKKSKKLLKLKVDTGIDQRTVLSGIAQFYKPEEVIGKQVCILVNLAPRKMMGVESQGMILMAEDHDGKLSFVQPEDSVSNGSQIS